MHTKDLGMNKLQEVQLALLEEVVRICRKHQIRFYLVAGSALGAVRHSGFIPWDDDIDIGMPRPDYERFLSLAQRELGTSLFLQTPDTDPAYPNMYAKIRNSETTFVECSVAHLTMNHGVYLDISPYDGYPTRTFIARITERIIGFCLAARFRKSGVLRNDTRNKRTLRSSISGSVVFLLSSVLSLRQLQLLLDHLARRYDYDASESVINWYNVSATRELAPREFFGGGREVKFENLLVPIPSNADGYLKMAFGDYMTPPPENERVSQHATDIIDILNPYERHMSGNNSAIGPA